MERVDAFSPDPAEVEIEALEGHRYHHGDRTAPAPGELELLRSFLSLHDHAEGTTRSLPPSRDSTRDWFSDHGLVAPESRLPGTPVTVGTSIMLGGRTNAQGFVEAEYIEILGPDIVLPTGVPTEMESSEDNSGHGNSGAETNENSGQGNENDDHIEDKSGSSNEDQAEDGTEDNSDDSDDNSNSSSGTNETNNNEDHSEEDRSGKGGGEDQNDSSGSGSGDESHD